MSTGIVSRTAPTRSFYNKAISYFKTHGILLSAYLNLACNTARLAQKLFVSFPESLSLRSRAIQKLAGLFFFAGLQKEWVKSCRDTYAFYQRRNLLGLIVSGNKLVFQSVDICLVAGGTIVAIAAARGHPQWSTKFYRFMLPFTLTSQLLSCIQLISNLAIYRILRADTCLRCRDRDLWTQVQLSAWDKENLQNRNVYPPAAQQEQLERNFICSGIDLAIAALFHISQALEKLNSDSRASIGLTWSVSVISIASLHYRKQTT